MEKMPNSRLVETGEMEQYRREKYQKKILSLLEKGGKTTEEIKQIVIKELIGGKPSQADLVTIESLIQEKKFKESE